MTIDEFKEELDQILTEFCNNSNNLGYATENPMFWTNIPKEKRDWMMEYAYHKSHEFVQDIIPLFPKQLSGQLKELLERKNAN